jgi:TolA-binding protein
VLERPRACIKAFFTLALLAATGCSVNATKKSYVLAEKLWTDGKYAAAVAEFEKVTARDSSGKLGLQALYRAASTEALFLGRYSDALRKYRRFAEMAGEHPTSWEAQKQVGEILFVKLEHFDQAIQHYRALLRQKPESPEAPEYLFRIAKSHFFLWQFNEAVRVYRELVRKHPDSPWAEKATFEIGVTYFTRGEQHSEGRGTGKEGYQEAIDAYNQFLKKYPQSDLAPQAKFGIASCLEELDQLDAAYHAYESLKETYPSPKVVAIKLVRIKERKEQRSR